MKLLAILSLVSIAVAASAQTANAPGESAGIKILRVELQHAASRAPQLRSVPSTDPASQSQDRADRMRDVDSNPALHRLSQNAEIAPTTGSDPFGNLPAGSHRIFIVSLLVKNIGTKTITVVNWEYLQFEVNGKEPVKRYRVQSKRIIPPGELAEFTKEVEPKGKEHQALVTRIEYADGSFWQER